VLTGLDISQVSSGGLLARVRAGAPITGYESFTLPDPPRLVVDIPNATHAIGQPIAAHPPLVTAVRSSQYRERPVKIVRVVFDLRALMPYRVVSGDRDLRVEIGTASAEAAAPTSAEPPDARAGTPPKPASAEKAVAKVTRVDVQHARGRQRIVIGTTGAVTYRVQEAAGAPGLWIDVTGATIEPSASRTLDLRQVTSPLQRIRSEQLKADPDPVVRVTAHLKAPVGYEVRLPARRRWRSKRPCPHRPRPPWQLLLRTPSAGRRGP
jgi:hypothetical protein